MTKQERQLQRLRKSGHFLKPDEIESPPPRQRELREISGHSFAVTAGIRNYFWPFLVWLSLRGRETNVSYVSFLEQVDRDDDMFFGLEAYALWRPQGGVVLVSWSGRRDPGDVVAELGHLDVVRSRIYERLHKLGSPYDGLEIDVALVSPIMEFDDIAGLVEIEPDLWVGREKFPKLGLHLDSMVERMGSGPGPVEQLLSATGILVDHEFPSQPLTAMPLELFEEVANARAA